MRANLVDVILHGAFGESPHLKRADHTGGDCAAESKYPFYISRLDRLQV